MKGRGLCGVTGGLLWIAGGVLRLAPERGASAAGSALVLVAAALLAAALHGLVARWRPVTGRHGRVARVLGLGGLALFAAGRLGLPPSVPVAALGAAGLLMVSAALVVVGNAALVGSVAPGWQALPGVLGLLGLFLPLGAGIDGLAGAVVWVLWGLGWAWLGLILTLERPRPPALAPAAVRRR